MEMSNQEITLTTFQKLWQFSQKCDILYAQSDNERKRKGNEVCFEQKTHGIIT